MTEEKTEKWIIRARRTGVILGVARRMLRRDRTLAESPRAKVAKHNASTRWSSAAPKYCQKGALVPGKFDEKSRVSMKIIPQALAVRTNTPSTSARPIANSP